MNNIYAALEIGTTRTVIAVGEASENGRLKVTCHEAIPSTGVRKSQILDVNQATESIRAVLRKIEKRQEAAGTSISIGNAVLVVSGQHIAAVPANGSTPVRAERVDEEDIVEAQRAAHAAATPRERELLDIADQDYTLDNRGGILNPKGMSGRVLGLNTLQIQADKNRIQDARTAAEAAHLEIREPLYAVSCAADAVLEEHERKNGALVIDFGGGSTGYAVYLDGYLVTTGVIGVGGDHITNDIAHAFQTTNAQAENMKVASASAILSRDTAEPMRIRVEPGENTLMDNRTVSKTALDTVVNARMLELLAIIRAHLEDLGLLHRLHAGIIITGGGAALRNIDVLIEQTLGMPTRRGRPINVDGLEDVPEPAAYATIAGALLYAYKNYESRSFLGDILGRFFK